MNATPMPDDAIPGSDDLDDVSIHAGEVEPVRTVKPFEIIWTISHDRLIPMSQALEILKGINWQEVEL